MIFRTAILAAACIFCASAPAAAQVTYQLQGDTFANQIAATFTVPTFLTGLGFIDASALDSCTPFTGFGAATCGGVSYNDNSGGQNQLGIQSNITGGGPVSFYYYFASGDFGSVGTFTAASNGNTGTLTVSGAPAAVPELATWAMMLLGFTGIGMAMRRQRAPTLAQVA